MPPEAGVTTTSETTGDWRESLPEGLREAPFIKAAESVDKAVEQISNAASHMGHSVRVPGPDAGDDARKEFYEKILEKAPDLMPKPSDDNMDDFYKSLGRPDNPDEYKVEIPEDREVPSDFSQFSTIAHKHGLSQKQFQGIMSEILDSSFETQDNLEHEQAEALKGLSKEWGAAYEDRMKQVKNFLRLTDAPEGLVELVSNDALSPDELKWIHSVATSTQSDVELAKMQDPQNVALSPYEAQNQIQEMLNNPDGPYWDASSPNHKRAIERMLELQKMAHPGAAA